MIGPGNGPQNRAPPCSSKTCPQCLRLRIFDEGPGIPPAELEQVFEPFYRLEDSRSRETGGTRLGLSIVRNTAQMHSSSIEPQNRAQGGLEVVLTLPRKVAMAVNSFTD